MQISIRDATVFAAQFPTLREGLNALQINSVELWFDRENCVASLTTPEGKPRVSLQNVVACQKYRKELEAIGLQVCAFCMANDFSLPDPDAEIQWLIRASAAAKLLGAPVLRVDAYLKNATDWTVDQRIQRFASCMKKVLAAPEADGMEYGIENHGPLGNDPQFLEGVLHAVGDSRLGLTIDTANFYWSGKPLEEVHRVIEQFAPRAKHTHVKNIGYPAETRNQSREVGWRYAEFNCALPDGDIDLQRVAKALKTAGYHRTLCIENESLNRYPANEQRQEILRRDADHLRKILNNFALLTSL